MDTSASLRTTGIWANTIGCVAPWWLLARRPGVSGASAALARHSRGKGFSQLSAQLAA